MRGVAVPLQRGLPVRRLDDLVVRGAQVADDDLAHGRVVVHHEHSGHGHLRREPTSEAVTTPTSTRPASTSQPTV